jgi:hypothetical protein
VKKQTAFGVAFAALIALGACSSSPTDSSAAAPSRIQADELASPAGAPQPQDTTTQRVPNLFGSGN